MMMMMKIIKKRHNNNLAIEASLVTKSEKKVEIVFIIMIWIDMFMIAISIH